MVLCHDMGEFSSPTVKLGVKIMCPSEWGEICPTGLCSDNKLAQADLLHFTIDNAPHDLVIIIQFNSSSCNIIYYQVYS